MGKERIHSNIIGTSTTKEWWNLLPGLILRLNHLSKRLWFIIDYMKFHVAFYRIFRLLLILNSCLYSSYWKGGRCHFVDPEIDLTCFCFCHRGGRKIRCHDHEPINTMEEELFHYDIQPMKVLFNFSSWLTDLGSEDWRFGSVQLLACAVLSCFHALGLLAELFLLVPHPKSIEKR